jgi:hypothetical protein
VIRRPGNRIGIATDRLDVQVRLDLPEAEAEGRQSLAEAEDNRMPCGSRPGPSEGAAVGRPLTRV